MTAQIPETIMLDGERQYFGALRLPLDGPLAKRGIKLQWWISTNLRGYVGHWALRDGSLFLLGLEDAEDRRGKRVGLDDIFPGREPPIFTDWFTGELTVSFGALLRYAHVGFASMHEFERKLTFADGRLTSDVTKRNTLEQLRADRQAMRDFLANFRARPWRGRRLTRRLLEPGRRRLVT